MNSKIHAVKKEDAKKVLQGRLKSAIIFKMNFDHPFKKLSQARNLLKSIVSSFALCLTANSVCMASDAPQIDSQQDEFSALMVQADKDRKAGIYEQAVKEYSLAIPRSPRNFLPYKWRAVCYFRLDKNREALADVERWGALHSPDTYCLLLKCVLLANLGRYVEALPNLNAAVKQFPDRQLAWLERSLVKMELGQFKGSRPDAFEHLNIFPFSTFSFELCSISSALCAMPDDAVFFLGQYAHTKLHRAPEVHLPGQYEKKKSNLQSQFSGGVLSDSQRQQLIANLNNKPNALSIDQRIFARGVIYFYLRQFAQAAKEIARSPSARSNVNLLLVTFYSHILENHPAEAQVDLQIMTKVFPSNANVLDALDIYYYEIGQRQASITEIRNLLSLNPRNAAALVTLFKVYRDLNQFSEAEKFCDEALRLDPDNEKLFLAKSQLLVNRGKDTLALNVIDKLLSVNHDSGPAYMLLAEIFTRQEKWTQAIDALSQAIRLKYNYVKALEARSACYRILKKTELANKDEALAEDIDPGLWQLHLLTP